MIHGIGRRGQEVGEKKKPRWEDVRRNQDGFSNWDSYSVVGQYQRGKRRRKVLEEGRRDHTAPNVWDSMGSVKRNAVVGEHPINLSMVNGDLGEEVGEVEGDDQWRRAGGF